MSLNEKQLAMYRAEWGKVRQMLRRLGVSPKEADAARMGIHRRMGILNKDGDPKSSVELTNAELTRVLAAFWCYTTLPENKVMAMLRQTQASQVAIMGRWPCEQIFLLIHEIDPEEIEKEGIPKYVEGMFYQINGGCYLGGANPATGNAEQWHKVMLASCYRYDQVVRRLLGEQGNRHGVRYWPHNHQRILADLQEAGVIDRPEEPDYAAPDENEDVPF
ncbi:hypothetical protein H5P28_00145 [Ruficoccus amylovorans]|uniref:Uncharacterized protein n=1 Tax=Ruficoccus amylovorans TaxID=1804625 RepID=A0A842HB51_9BACT|nr:hypothetical protein [Ruficoccus amylovorans]MBC2592661.1 hypothetical protein [Ruficoccus amylovorans]